MKNLLIHACCADCLLKLLESLKSFGYTHNQMTAYFYNPNIHPRTEYLARLQAIKKITKNQKIKLVIPNWSPREYFRSIKMKDTIAKNRCDKCWYNRLYHTANYAKNENIDNFTTTLITSHFQDSKTIIRMAKIISIDLNINFILPEKIEKDLHTNGFYKQNYCGCCYSLVDRFNEKYIKADQKQESCYNIVTIAINEPEIIKI